MNFFLYLSGRCYFLGAATPEYFVARLINCGGAGFAINDCGDKRAIRKSPDPGVLPIEIMQTKTHQLPATDGF